MRGHDLSVGLAARLKRLDDAVIRYGKTPRGKLVLIPIFGLALGTDFGVAWWVGGPVHALRSLGLGSLPLLGGLAGSAVHRRRSN
jgi:hypothetical protein